MIRFENQTTNPVVLSDEIELTDEQLKSIAGALGEPHEHEHDHAEHDHAEHDRDRGHEREGWHHGWDDEHPRYQWFHHQRYYWSPYYQQWILC